MNLFVMWTDSFGDALKTSNQLSSDGGHILDCSIIGRWAQVMVHFDGSLPDQSIVNRPAAPTLKTTWIPNVKTQIIESYLSLSTHPVLDFLLTVETSFIGNIFEFLQSVDLDTFPIVDLRLLRFNEPKSLLLLTGAQADSDKLLVIIENLKAQGKVNFSFDLIQPVTGAIKELFHHVETVP